MTAVWELPFSVPDQIAARARRVRAALFDVDGVLTDGRLYIGGDGEAFKCFDVQDGHGLHMLATAGIVTGIITARESAAVRHRAKELSIPYCYTGCSSKLTAFTELLDETGLNAADCCYVGDDLVDVPVMMRCGLAVAVANANHVVQRIAHWTTPAEGGRGAVRQVCETILWAQQALDPLIVQCLQPKPA